MSWMRRGTVVSLWAAWVIAFADMIWPLSVWPWWFVDIGFAVTSLGLSWGSKRRSAKKALGPTRALVG